MSDLGLYRCMGCKNLFDVEQLPVTFDCPECASPCRLDRRGERLEPGRRLSDVICPQCRRPFRLLWRDDYDPVTKRNGTLLIRSCPSGGIYDVSISCPHCNYNEDL